MKLRPSVGPGAAATGEIPYNYVGIVHVNSLDEFYQKDKTSQKF
jgi:hypothetical protein